MAINVLEVFLIGAVNVARQIQGEVVLRITDFGEWHHSRVLWNFNLVIESVNDLVNVLLPQAVLVTVLEEALARIDNKDAFAGGSVLLIEYDNAGRNTGS